MFNFLKAKPTKVKSNGSNVNIHNPLVHAVMLEADANISSLTKHQLMENYLKSMNDPREGIALE